MFNFINLFFGKRTIKRSTPIIVDKGHYGDMDTIIMIGDYIKFNDGVFRAKICKVTDIKNSGMNDRDVRLAIAMYGQSQNSNWDYVSLKKSNNENVRALVAANGYFLHELLYDESPIVLSAVLNRLIGSYSEERMQDLAKSLNNLYMKIPKHRRTEDVCLFCGFKFFGDNE